MLPSQGGRKEGFIMKKYCVKCGHEFIATGREVICPSCREAAKEEAKKAAVLKAKRASWMGESVPVRISGRASTIIRRYGAANDLPFAQALDDLLKASAFFKSTGGKWEDVEPYRSHRRDKHATEDEQDKPQDVTSKPQESQESPHDVKQAAKSSSKSTSKSTSKSSSKTSTSKSSSKSSSKATSK